MNSPKYYWLIGVGLILLLVIGYSLSDSKSSEETSSVAKDNSELVDSRMAIVDKNATARSVIKNMMIDKSTKVTVIAGTALALSDYVLAFSNKKKYRGYLDLNYLTPKSEGSYVLWSQSPTGEYKKIRVFPPKSEFLQYDVPEDGHTLLITLETAGAGDQPNLNSIIAKEQIEN